MSNILHHSGAPPKVERFGPCRRHPPESGPIGDIRRSMADIDESRDADMLGRGRIQHIDANLLIVLGCLS